ncbi:hypothetical protein [Herminiimonas sp. CN]|uniref:hypothetical protein n=1 Tax=Herminiimonas sp. CN TaxID=1349818 RepID=UPI0012DC1730|nr:hypothetical protein [Herminiimonas sp. CN]
MAKHDIPQRSVCAKKIVIAQVASKNRRATEVCGCFLNFPGRRRLARRDEQGKRESRAIAEYAVANNKEQ